MQTLSIKLLCCSWQISLGRISIFFKTRCSRKAVPQGITEKLRKQPLCPRCNCPVTFINNKSYMQIFYAVIFGRILFQPLFYCDWQLLNSCDNNLLIFIFQLFNKVANIFSFVNINNIIICVWFKRIGRLPVKVFSVNEKNSLFNVRNINQQIPCCFVACHCLSWACCMPYISRFLPFRCFSYRFYGVYLIGAEKQKLIFILVKHNIFHHHLMCFGDFKDRFGKFQIIGNRLVILIFPTGKEFLVKLLGICRSKIFGFNRIGNDKHLYSGENTCEFSLSDIFLYLSESVHKWMLTIFKFDMYKRYSVYQQRYIKTAVLIVNIIGFFVL